MGKEKRKTRLDKGSGGATGGDFVGFGAFAAQTSAISMHSNEDQTTKTNLQWSPVYTGSDGQLSIAFKKISQKKDGNTKAKALLEMKEFFDTETVAKKEQIVALSHLFFLFHSKLVYDDFASVRSSCLVALDAGRNRLPKAFRTLASKHSEILGMIWSAQTDPSVEVRTVAEPFFAFFTAQDWDGLWQYASRILAYGRPRKMHDDIFAKKNSEDEKMTDTDKEQLAERFERIVGSTLSGLSLWFRKYPDTGGHSCGNPVTPLIWKTLSNAKASIRRHAYVLLATMSQKSKSIVYGSTGSAVLPELLITVTNQEADPANFPQLLETLLVYISGCQKGSLDATSFVKAINKSLKRACRTSSASEWAPLVLPLLAGLSDSRHIVSLLSTLADGRVSTTVISDGLWIASAMNESTAFFLLRDDVMDPLDESTAARLIAFWLESLRMYLSLETTTSTSREAQKNLQNQIGKTLVMFDEASTKGKQCAMIRTGDALWAKDKVHDVVMSSNLEESKRRLKEIVLTARRYRTRSDTESRLCDVLGAKLNATLSPFQASSSIFPDEQDYELMESIFAFGSPGSLLAMGAPGGKVTDFVTNDVLRWVVVHASSMKTASGLDIRNKTLALHDFTVIRLCIQSIEGPDCQARVWNTVLRELETARCDYDILAGGLQKMLNADIHEQDSMMKIIGTTGLEELSIKTVDQCLLDPSTVPVGSVVEFLSTCSGKNVPGALVGRQTISKWVAKVSAMDVNNNIAVAPLVRLLLGQRISKLLDVEDLSELCVQAWKVGGQLWTDVSLPLLMETESPSIISSKFSSKATLVLEQLLSEIIDSPVHTDLLLMFNRCQTCGSLGARFSAVIRHATDVFAVIGFTRPYIWSKSGEDDSSVTSQRLQWVLSDILHNVQVPENLFSPDTASMQLFTTLLVGTANPKNGSICTALLGDNIDVCLGDGFLLQCVRCLVEMLRDVGTKPQRLHQCVIALSAIVDFSFKPILANVYNVGRDAMDVNEIDEGMSLWYIKSPEHSDIRQVAKVVKVHRDDLPRVYFTVEIEETDGSPVEKQTVAERLSTKQLPSYMIPREEKENKDELVRREGVSSVLLSRVIPCMKAAEWSCLEQALAAAECFSIVVSRIGCLGRSGIGSHRYELFQTVMSLQEGVLTNSAAKNFDMASQLLHILSVALGNSNTMLPSPHIMQYFNFDPSPSVDSLVDIYRKEMAPQVLNEPSLRWITLALRYVAKRPAALNLLAKLSLMQLQVDDKDAFSLATRGLHQIVCHMSDRADLSAIPFFREAFSLLTLQFAESWPSIGPFDPGAGKNELPKWTGPFSQLADDMVVGGEAIVQQALRKSISPLLQCLGVDSKRWISFQLMCCAGRLKSPHHVGAEVDDLPPTLKQRLKHWTKDSFIPEEAEELEDDILTVFEWVPTEIMEAIESWIDDAAYFDERGDDISISHFLLWLVFLEYLKSAVASEVRNRAAFSSYSHISGAVFFILSASIIHLDVSGDRRNDPLAVVSSSDIFSNTAWMETSDIAATVFLHTVETFPTLSKRWWEEDCPKALLSIVNKFVELKVAPRTFENELKRMKVANKLDDLSVQGSAVSREVTATYHQDECMLSLLIKIPTNFPLRNIDVDGKKTLGVPQARSKRWELQIRQMLNNQDGTLVDALMLWKRNVDKEFEGVEPCPVCYSVLAVKSHELPNLECKTCAHRFHSSCLHKWFASSGKSQCVLCQQPWSGVRIS